MKGGTQGNAAAVEKAKGGRLHRWVMWGTLATEMISMAS